jgi:hypothetical protein
MRSVPSRAGNELDRLIRQHYLPPRDHSRKEQGDMAGMHFRPFLRALVLLVLPLMGARWADPIGDQLEPNEPAGPDLTAVELVLDDAAVTVKLTLDPASSEFLNSLEGMIDFDADADPSTGGVSWIEASGSEPFPAMGVDYSVSFSPGIATLVQMTAQGPSLLGFSAPTVVGQSVVVAFPSGMFCAAGSPCLTDGCTLAVMVGANGAPTDRAPNGGIPLGVGDFDANGLVNGADVQHLQSCRSGPAIRLVGGCEDADLDADGDVDLDDFGILQRALRP